MITLQQVCSKDYKALLQERYTRPGWGASGYSWANVVKGFAEQLGAKSILDYGCGRGTLKQAMAGWDVREYDPGIIGKDVLPEPADLVVATDVLEHIEPDKLGHVLTHIRGLARKGVFLNIAMGPAKEVLADGRNAHLIQQQPKWWDEQLAKAWLWPSQKAVAKGYNVWVAL